MNLSSQVKQVYKIKSFLSLLMKVKSFIQA